MQNFTDVWGVILDDNCKPLVGKIGFYEPNTTTLKNIFGTDEVIPLDNPVYCNGVTTSQVLLDEGDYTVRYWRYIGNGNMESDQNENSWFLYKTELVKDGSVVNTNFSGDGVVDTIDELKSLTGMQDGDLCLVNGYFTKDDCPARYFVWHENGSYDDDGGVCIKANSQNTGAWIMKIPGTYIDVRWFGDIPSNAWNGTSSNLGQRAKAASAANKYSKDLYFPSYKGGTQNGFYVFNGSNTVSVRQNIICDDSVRFVVKHGTSGTVISCSEFIKDGRYLFISEYGEQIGGYQLIADWIKTSWLNGNTTNVLNWARQGFILDEMQSPITFQDTKLKVENSPFSGTTWINCEVEECNKKITNNITIQNMEIDTDWFADNYSWGNLSISGCRILLANCKDADTYIVLKNKQLDANYGDLGEQTINARVLGNCILENFAGTITMQTHGGIETHNASVTIIGLNTSDTLNCVDTWLTLNSNTVIDSISLRRGSIVGTGTLQAVHDSMIDNADISISFNLLGTNSTIKNSNINAQITATNITLDHDNVYATVDQRDTDGYVNVHVRHCNFGVGGEHYVHAYTVNSIVVGEWIGNTCDYDNKHWIRLDRTNLDKFDYSHRYTYKANEEPYISKYNGYNLKMNFKQYRGNMEDGRNVFASQLPFMFMNDNTYELSVVSKNNYWRMFTVGNKYTRRSGRLVLQRSYVGIQESNYSDHTNGHAPIVLNWGMNSYTLNGVTNVFMNAYCHDSDNAEAEYKWCFTQPGYIPATVYSNGTTIGFLSKSPYDGWSLDWPVYPNAGTGNTNSIYVFIDQDFESKPQITQN